MERPDISSRLSREYFERQSRVVAKDLLGRTIIRQLPDGKEIAARIKEVAAWQGEEKSSAETMNYAPGYVGISTKFGKNLIDIATSAEYRASCITLIALDTPKETVQGPGNVSKYLQVDKSFNNAPIDHPSLWIGGEPIEESRIIKRTKSNVPANCRGYFYFR